MRLAPHREAEDDEISLTSNRNTLFSIRRVIGMRVLIVEDDGSVAQSPRAHAEVRAFQSLTLPPWADESIKLRLQQSTTMTSSSWIRTWPTCRATTCSVLCSRRLGVDARPHSFRFLPGIEDKVRALGVGFDDCLTKPSPQGRAHRAHPRDRSSDDGPRGADPELLGDLNR